MNMRYACSGDLRIEPLPNAVGTCQICGNEVKAYCGVINKWHWRHNKLPDCDSFHEPMTEWHKSWQNKFPEDWREVVLVRNNEKHFADILTSQNLVIEFQHSSITPNKILERELFYNCMIWVVDAMAFKNNLKINDLLKGYLDKLKKKYNKTDPYSGISNIIDREITFLKSEILGLNNQLFNYPNILERKRKSLAIYEKTLQGIDEYLSNKAFITWEKKGRILNEYSENLDMDEVEIRKQIIDLQERMDSYINRLDQINVVLKENNSFIQNQELKGKFELQRNEIQEKIRFLEQSFQEIYNEVKSIFLEGLPDLIKKKKYEIQKCELELPKLKKEINLKNKAIEQIERNKVSRIADFLEKKSSEFEKEMQIIKYEYDNVYSYEWKHERRSWKSASKPIFLDFGDEYLFEIKSTNLLKRISKTHFVIHYSSNQ